MSPRTAESPLSSSSSQASSSPQDFFSNDNTLNSAGYKRLRKKPNKYWKDVNKGLRLKTKLTVLKLLKVDAKLGEA